ncbi:MAG: ShlB/FhaC/HecB family hemolysin secretion/activation protein [Urechidicola sp.]|nr:ShlB/FhaC/HecB family hemolysin secretion/activation protein [Urechidicola sp.]
MKSFFTPYIYTLFLLLIFQSAFTQEIELKIIEKESINNSIFNLIEYRHFHSSENSVYAEIDSVKSKLHRIGYLNARFETIQKQDSTYTSYLELGKNTKTIKIFFDSNNIDINTVKKHTSSLTDSSFTINMYDVSNLMNALILQFELDGKSFTEVALKNIRTLNDELIAELNINSTKSRTIDNIIIKAYEKFPQSFVKHRLNLKTGTVFNTEKLQDASKAIQAIAFVSEIKSPEVLFTNDSTSIYLYLQKIKANRFDGLIGFATDEEGKLKFNGYLDLLLNNILNKGESISIQWKSNGDDRKLFNLDFTAPYIFKTPITFGINFNLYKQDSTFLNIHTEINLAYTLNQFSEISGEFESENSNDLVSENTVNNIKGYKSTFFGASYNYRKPDENKPFQDKFYFDIKALWGNRTLTENTAKTNQQEYNLHASYLWSLNQKSNIFIQSKSGILISENLFSNELFRIGGANSIRGFDQESIFVSAYTILNLEYRYHLAQKSYMYSITDFAYVQNDIINENGQLFGFGLGYVFNTKNGAVDISYALGKRSDFPVDFQNSKFHIRLLQYF